MCYLFFERWIVTELRTIKFDAFIFLRDLSSYCVDILTHLCNCSFWCSMLQLVSTYRSDIPADSTVPEDPEELSVAAQLDVRWDRSTTLRWNIAMCGLQILQNLQRSNRPLPQDTPGKKKKSPYFSSITFIYNHLYSHLWLDLPKIIPLHAD